MRVNRLHQLILLVGLVPLSWLGAMAVHELGHVLAAVTTGGDVQRVVLHPLALSRTDVDPNPRPGIVVWAGPLVGVALPLLACVIGGVLRLRWNYLLQFFAGACLIVNGAYLLFGSVDGIGDTGVMMATGTPRWVLITFGVVTLPAGVYLWHRASARLGFGRDPYAIPPVHAWATFAVMIVAVTAAALLGDAG